MDHVTETELRRRAENVIQAIEVTAPQSDGTHSFTNGVPGNISGGALARSFQVAFTTSHGKRVLRIFSTAQNSRGQSYAGMVSRGTRPHVISGNPNLRFFWIRNALVVVNHAVSHPGTRPNNYLQEALRLGFHR
jgi:hypothetical protein